MVMVLLVEGVGFPFCSSRCCSETIVSIVLILALIFIPCSYYKYYLLFRGSQGRSVFKEVAMSRSCG